MKTINKRWAIVNKNTGSVRRSTATRDQARFVKSRNERIYDTINQVFVR
jgi:hypothetical protein